jgi:transposase
MCRLADGDNATSRESEAYFDLVALQARLDGSYRRRDSRDHHPGDPVPRRSDRTDPKTAELLADGTLNPAPEKVADPKFRAGEFFDPRDLVQVRYEMLRRVSVDDLSVTQVSAGYGVSRPTYYQAKASFGEAGLAGLVPQKRGPRGPHKLQGDLLAFVEKHIVPGKPLRARELARLIQKEFSVEVHPRTIERACSRKKAPLGTPEPVSRRPPHGRE